MGAKPVILVQSERRQAMKLNDKRFWIFEAMAIVFVVMTLFDQSTKELFLTGK